LTKYWENIVFSSENSTNFGKVLENSLDFRYHKIGGKKTLHDMSFSNKKGRKKVKKKKKKDPGIFRA